MENTVISPTLDHFSDHNPHIMTQPKITVRRSRYHRLMLPLPLEAFYITASGKMRHIPRYGFGVYQAQFSYCGATAFQWKFGYADKVRAMPICSRCVNSYIADPNARVVEGVRLNLVTVVNPPPTVIPPAYWAVDQFGRRTATATSTAGAGYTRTATHEPF